MTIITQVFNVVKWYSSDLIGSLKSRLAITKMTRILPLVTRLSLLRGGKRGGARDYPDLPVQGIAGLHARRQEAVFQTRKQGFTNVNYTYMYMRFRLWAMTWRS